MSVKGAVGRTSATVRTGVLCESLEDRRLFAADLLASVQAPLSALAPAGGRNVVALRVTNVGDVGVSRTSVGINVVASTDQTLDAGDLVVFESTKRLSVKAGSLGGANVKLSFATPVSVPNGEYFLLVQVDAAGAVAEIDEVNNVAVATTTPVPLRQPSLDLPVTLAGNTSAGLKQKLQLAVSNASSVPLRGLITLNVYGAPTFAGADGVPTQGADILVGSVVKQVSLKLGGSAKLTVPVDFALVGNDSDIAVSFSASFIAPLSSPLLPPPPKEEVANLVADVRTIQDQVNDALDSGQATPDALEAARQVLAARPDVVQSSIRVSDTAISFITFQNLLGTLQARTRLSSSAV